MDKTTTLSILTALGADWRDVSTNATSSMSAILQQTTGYGVRLWWSKNRIEISGIYPKTKAGSEEWPRERPTITVSASRPPTAIAQQIVRRFLPVYLPVYETQVQRVASVDAYAAKTTDAKSALLALPGVRASHHGEGLYISGYYPYTITVQGNSVRFEAFSVPLDVALNVLPLLREPVPVSDDE